ncbi:MAG TPA: hypothetical protein VK589_02215 [Chryseolinea sp.]|nr:hypothetical protein [Chryseolinea sp.]
MDNLFEPPSKQLWQQRSLWIENEIEKAETGLSYLASDHSVALFYDMQRAYCAGAWISVVVMAVSSIDSHFRETESGDNRAGTASLLKEFYEGEVEEIDWLRKLRNKYVHLNLQEPFLEMDTWFNNQVLLEADATKAIKIAIKAFYQNPGT